MGNGDILRRGHLGVCKAIEDFLYQMGHQPTLTKQTVIALSLTELAGSQNVGVFFDYCFLIMLSVLKILPVEQN